MIAALDNAREASPPEQKALLLKAHVEKVKAVLFPLHAAARDQLVANRLLRPRQPWSGCSSNW